MFYYNDEKHSTHTVIEEVSDMIDYKSYAADLARVHGQAYRDAAQELESQRRVVAVGKIINGVTTIASDPCLGEI
jgi:hypothetical protein